MWSPGEGVEGTTLLRSGRFGQDTVTVSNGVGVEIFYSQVGSATDSGSIDADRGHGYGFVDGGGSGAKYVTSFSDTAEGKPKVTLIMTTEQ